MNINEAKRDFETTWKPRIQQTVAKDSVQTVLGEAWDGYTRLLYQNGKEYVKYWQNPYTGLKTDMEV